MLPDINAMAMDEGLLALDEELLLSVLEQLDSLTLCRMQRVCTRFARHEKLTPAGSPPLCLPERAACNAVARAYEEADGSLRAYEKGATEPWRQVLLLHERGLLARGVFLDLPMRAFDDKKSGWRRAYYASYEHRTKDRHIEVPAAARYIALGAVDVTGCSPSDGKPRGMPARKDFESGEQPCFTLLAWAKRDTVLRTTHAEDKFGGGATSSDNLEDGVYWYRWPKHAMGFSADPDLFLWLADSGCSDCCGGRRCRRSCCSSRWWWCYCQRRCARVMAGSQVQARRLRGAARVPTLMEPRGPLDRWR